MKLLRPLHSLPVSLLLLRSASALVPGAERAEWLAEWKAELWYVRHARGRAPHGWFQGSEETTAFCLGAFQDAFWLRRNHSRGSVPAPRSVFRLVPGGAGAATRCGFALAICAAASFLLCLCFPGTRKVLLPSPYGDAGNLVILSTGGYAGIQAPAIRLSDYQSWKANTQPLFTELAFYQPATSRVHIARHQTATLSIARASDNLFQLLNLPLSIRSAVRRNSSHSTTLVLSGCTWRGIFQSDPNITGRVVEIAGQPVLIARVLADDSWRLPGRFDGWLLEDEDALNVLPSKARGFVLAHVRASGFPAPAGEWRTMTVVRDDGETDRFDCLSLTQRDQKPFAIFLFTLLLACLALPATTPLPLGDYPARSGLLHRPASARRWIFLAIKFALLLPIVFFCSINLAYIAYPPDSPATIYLQCASSFFGFLFAFRWALRDQRRRCPVCLRLLSNPARVGQASRNFLAWNGTELICTRGHGLLHIPELPTSWFSTQRWLSLDSSWRSLFAKPSVSSAGMV